MVNYKTGTGDHWTAFAAAGDEQNPKNLGWKREMWSDRGTEKEREMETAGHRQPAKKKKQSSATNATFLQIRQTLAETHPSFLSRRKLSSVTFFLLYPSLTVLTPSPAEPRNKEKKEAMSLPSFPSLPSWLFAEPKRQCGAFFSLYKVWS